MRNLLCKLWILADPLAPISAVLVLIVGLLIDLNNIVAIVGLYVAYAVVYGLINSVVVKLPYFKAYSEKLLNDSS